MEHLIESVRKYPCLWKVDSQDYKDNELKEAAWREVIKDCDLPTVKEAKTLWKKLRDGHRQATGSRKKTTSGQASTITTKWKYEDQMSFLLPNMKNRPVHTNIRTDSVNEDSEASNDSEVPNTSTSGEQQTASVSGNENFQPPKKNKSVVNILEQDLKRREKRSAERDILRKQILDGTLKNVSSSNKAMEKFFMSMCDTACELPTHLQMRIQRQIFNIVMEAKEQHYMQTQRVPGPGYTTNYNNMSLPSYLNSPMHPVSPSSLSSNSTSSDYLQSPAHYSLQRPPTASSTPMMPPNNNDTELIRQFSQQDNAAADAYYSGHHVQNPLPESSSEMTPQNTTHISTHDLNLRSFVANFDTTNNE